MTRDPVPQRRWAPAVTALGITIFVAGVTVTSSLNDPDLTNVALAAGSIAAGATGAAGSFQRTDGLVLAGAAGVAALSALVMYPVALWLAGALFLLTAVVEDPRLSTPTVLVVGVLAYRFASGMTLRPVAVGMATLVIFGIAAGSALDGWADQRLDDEHEAGESGVQHPE